MLVFAFDDQEIRERRLVIAPNELDIAELRALAQKRLEDERTARDAMLAAIPIGRAKLMAPRAFAKVSALKDKFERLTALRRLLQQIVLQAQKT